MSATDLIADMLTRIRNANMVKLDKVDIILTRMNQNLAEILKEEGYIKNILLKKSLYYAKNHAKYHINCIFAYSESLKYLFAALARLIISKTESLILYESIKAPILAGYDLISSSISSSIFSSFPLLGTLPSKCL